ncbi:MAG TPA: sterol desaturase family protein [Acidimicrobiales bacterium]|nr:sterol desaturase family protein [Acidimicrobiales bacterium]
MGLSDLLRAHVLTSAISASERATIGPALVAVVALVFAAERLWPAVPRRVTARGHVVDAAYLGVYALVAPAVTLLNTGFALVIERYAPFLRLPRAHMVPQAAVSVAVLVAIDALNWAAHVANHRVAVFWRFHALHHSQEEMSVLTTFRTHPLAHVSYVPAVLPAVVLAASGPVPTFCLVAYGCLVALPHANLRWSYGTLGRWVVSPAYHRLHHASVDVDGKRAVNFGFVLAVWDRVGGTAALPHGREVLATGIGGRPVPIEQQARGASVPAVVLGQLVQPLRLRSGLDR